MSRSTLAQQLFEIRQGLTGIPGGDDPHPYIEGVVGGQAVVTAFESIERAADGAAQWFLVTYPDVAHTIGAAHPTALPITEEQAREWVPFFAAMYANAAQEVSL